MLGLLVRVGYHTHDCQIADALVCVWGVQDVVDNIDSVFFKFITNYWSNQDRVKLVQGPI